MIFQVQHYFYDSCIEKRFSYFSPGSECRFLSRVEGRMSRVVGKLSRVEGKMSRVVFFIVFFNFGLKIFRLSGIYRNASLLIHAFPLFGASYFTFTCVGIVGV